MSNNERFTYLLTDINGVRIIRIRDVTDGRSRTRPSLRGIDASAYHLPLSASASAELCQLLRNSAETTCTTSPEEIEVVKLEG